MSTSRADSQAAKDRARELLELERDLELESLTLDELLKKDYPPRRDLVEGLIPKASAGLLSGVPKRGKTWVLQEIGAGLVSGTPVFGHFPVKRAVNVLLVLMEDSERDVRDRVEWLLRSRGIEAREAATMCKRLRVLARKPFSLQDPRCLRWIDLTIDQYNIEFIGLDPFREMFAGSERSDDLVKAAIKPLKALCYKKDVAFMLSHHQRKQSMKADEVSPRLADNASGTGYFSSYYDTGLHMDYGKPGTPFRIETEYRNGQDGFSFVLDRQHTEHRGKKLVHLHYSDAATNAQRKMERIKQQVREYLLDNPGAGAGAIEKSGGRKEDLTAALKEMVEKDRTVRVEKNGNKNAHFLVESSPCDGEDPDHYGEDFEENEPIDLPQVRKTIKMRTVALVK